MCIIAVSGNNIVPLDKEVLQRCFTKNPDGAGYAFWADDSLWHVHKGYMTFPEFWASYEAQKFSKDDYVVCHFRIGTSGSKDAGNTHPFPITDDVDIMRQTAFKVRNILIHNGVIGKGETIPSDTMCFVRDYAYPLLKFAKKEERLLEILREASEDARNRWFLTVGPTIHMWGNWEKSEEGWEFSNTGYEKPITTTYNAQNWNNYQARRRGYREYFNDKGDFDAEGWRNDMAKHLGITKPALPAPSYKNSPAAMQNGNIIETNTIENEGDFVYGVLSDNGAVLVWDRAPETEKEGAGTQYLFCPECFEDRHIMETPYQGTGDSLCYRCGAIFVDATGTIVTYDKDIRTVYEQAKKKDEMKRAEQLAKSLEEKTANA